MVERKPECNFDDELEIPEFPEDDDEFEEEIEPIFPGLRAGEVFFPGQRDFVPEEDYSKSERKSLARKEPAKKPASTRKFN